MCWLVLSQSLFKQWDKLTNRVKDFKGLVIIYSLCDDEFVRDRSLAELKDRETVVGEHVRSSEGWFRPLKDINSIRPVPYNLIPARRFRFLDASAQGGHKVAERRCRSVTRSLQPLSLSPPNQLLRASRGQVWNCVKYTHLWWQRECVPIWTYRCDEAFATCISAIQRLFQCVLL